MFGKYNLVAAPVVDTTNRLVGVITIDDVVDVIEEEADEDLKALGGVTSDEELSDNVWTIARARFNWLLVNLATAFLASSVLGLFEGQLEKMVALAVLAPIVASQGGNAATQTMGLRFRRVALRRRRHRPEQDRDIVEQAVGPGEFEERVDEDQDQPDALDFPQGGRGSEIDRQFAQHGQGIVGRPQQRQPAADRDQAGGGEEGRAVLQ